MERIQKRMRRPFKYRSLIGWMLFFIQNTTIFNKSFYYRFYLFFFREIELLEIYTFKVVYNITEMIVTCNCNLYQNFGKHHRPTWVQMVITSELNSKTDLWTEKNDQRKIIRIVVQDSLELDIFITIYYWWFGPEQSKDWATEKKTIPEKMWLYIYRYVVEYRWYNWLIF